MNIKNLVLSSILTGWLAFASGGISGGGGGGGVATPGVLSLRLSSESVPAGGIIQVKLLLTEPTPVATGKMDFAYDSAVFSDVMGINLIAPGGDVSGTAIVSDGRLSLHFTSPKGTFGSIAGYPIMTMAMKLRPGLLPGTRTTVTMDTNTSVFSALLGVPLAYAIKPGVITISNTVAAIYNVLPGGGKIKAGQPFTIVGANFNAGSKLFVESLARIRIQAWDANSMTVIPDADMLLDGTRLRITNPDKSLIEYYSYLRASSSGKSFNATMGKVVPLFSTKGYTDASFNTPDPVQNPNLVSGLGIENASGVDASVTLTMTNSFGADLGSIQVVVPAYMKFTRTVLDLFGIDPTMVSTVRAQSTSPIRFMGVALDSVANDVFPISVSGVVTP